MDERSSCESGLTSAWWAGPWGWLGRHARVVLGVYWVLLFMGTHWPKYHHDPPGEPWVFDQVIRVDKFQHVIAFGGLMALLLLAGVGGRKRPWVVRCGIALGVGVAYAFVDELTQTFSPGRELAASDLMTNVMAMLAVYLLALLPGEREPMRAPRALWWLLGLALPVLGVLALSPVVMKQAIDWKVAWLGGGSKHLHPADHIAHGVVAMVLSVVVIVVWPMASRRPRRAGACALAILVAAGPGVEVAQHFTGRGVEWQDGLAHAIGVLLAMMWWAARLTWSPSLREPASVGVPGGPRGDVPGGAAAPGM